MIADAEQLGLFSAPGPPIVRRDDPETSHAAAASLTPAVLGAQLRSVLWALDQNDRHSSHGGATVHDVVSVLTFGSVPAPHPGIVSSRLNNLAERGLIVKSGRTRAGPSGRGCTVFELTPAGRSALA